MSWLRNLLFIGVLLISVSARAQILFEPYVGYAAGNYKFTKVSEERNTGNIDGFAYGGKLALLAGNFLLGGEYQGARAQKRQNGQIEPLNWNNTTVFGILGYQFPMGLRISAGVSLIPHRSDEETDVDRTTYTGSAQKISLGFRYRLPLALNVDYIQYKLEKIKQGEVEGEMTERFLKTQYSAVLVSISFPFEI